MEDNFDNIEKKLAAALKNVSILSSQNEGFRKKWDDICSEIGLPINSAVLSQSDSISLRIVPSEQSVPQAHGIQEIINISRVLKRKAKKDPKGAYVLAIKAIAAEVIEDNSLAAAIVHILEGDQNQNGISALISRHKAASAIFQENPNMAYALTLGIVAEEVEKCPDGVIDLINSYGWTDKPLDDDGNPILKPGKKEKARKQKNASI